MRTVTISEALQFDDKDVIPCVMGRVKKWNKAHTGTNSNGPYSLQNMVLADGSSEIMLKLDGREELPQTFEGKLVRIFCNEGDRGKTGVYRGTDTYKKGNSPCIRVTKTGHIELANDAPPPQREAQADSQPSSQPAQAKTASKPPTKTAHAQQTNGHANGSVSVKVELYKASTLYLQCIAAANYVNDQHEEQFKGPMSPDHYQACVSSLFIWATREGLDKHVKTGQA